MYYVEIVSYETGEVVKRIECQSERSAERVERGVNINMDGEKFYTRILPA